MDVACAQYGALNTFIDPAKILQATTGGRKSPLAQVVTAGFSMMATTQILVTTLLAVKIYMATRGLAHVSRGTQKRDSAYSGVLWMIVESGLSSIVCLSWPLLRRNVQAPPWQQWR
jgi:hypothetical protein